MSSQSYLTIFLTITPEQSALQWFELIFFALAVPPLIYNWLVHRRMQGGSLGWAFIWNFAAMRTVGFILLKAGHTKDVLSAGTIISGASISPLFFGTAGIWHEVAHWHKQEHPFLYGWMMQIVLHLLVGGAIGMSIAGSVTQIYADTTPSYSQPLQIVGMALLLAIWIGYCFMLHNLWKRRLLNLERRLVLAVGLALPLLGIRTLYSLIGAAVNNPTWSYYRAPLAAQVIMQVLPDCLVIIIYIVGGLMTRHLQQERFNSEKQQDRDDGRTHTAYLNKQLATNV